MIAELFSYKARMIDVSFLDSGLYKGHNDYNFEVTDI
jgi:hypothetical protein